MKEVDEAISAFKDSVGPEIWKQTLVVTLTEFGRTAAENGSLGTDHGWGTCVFVMGGLLKKAGVIADWPGLSKSALFEARDLKATLDARSLYGKIISMVLQIDPEQAKRSVMDFPSSKVFDQYM